MSHAVLSPSAAGTWVNCPGSIKMQREVPILDIDQSAAAEGEIAHELAYNVLMNGLTTVECDNDEMREAVELYVNHIRSFNLPVYPEYKVQIQGIHPTDCYGTVDCWAYDPSKKVLRIWDFKYGYGFVDEVNNWQMITYTNGLLDLIGVNGLTDQETLVVITIIQPRAYGYEPIRKWSVKASDLRGHFNQLSGSANEALGDNPVCKTGTHCYHCSASYRCGAFNKVSLEYMDYTEQLNILDVDTSSLGNQLSALKKISKILEAKLTGVEEQVKSLIASGQRVDGWRTESVPGKLKWSIPVDQVIVKMGAKLMKIDVITPTQAKKVIDESVINEYSVRESSLKLVKDDNKKSSQIFGKQME